ncbi:MAG: cyclic nucleotide-binding domain-containing protein [Myxococcales bacterium]|nr:MAG: cyclic nucleotide-binding domain-containing protein [Myxococcales bacterium]
MYLREDTKEHFAITRATLSRLSLFHNFDEETLAILESELKPQPIETGVEIVSEGKQDLSLYVVLSGELEVVKSLDKGNQFVRVAMLGPGGWFGEMSLLDPQPRSASVRALAPSILLPLSAQQIRTLIFDRDMRTYAALITNIARELSRRLRVTSGILSQAANIAHNG